MRAIFILVIIISFSLNCQVVISSNDLMGSGENHEIVNAFVDDLNFNLSNTGINYSWDYSSSFSTIFVDTISTVSVNETSLAYQFYFNNLFLYPEHYASYALKGQDLVGSTQLEIKDRFDYYALDNNSLRLTGYGAKLNGVPTSVKYDTIDQILPLPLEFGIEDSTSASYILSVPSLGSYGQSIKRKVEVDGWGTLTTPHNEYDAIRVKTTLYQTDTIYIDQFGFGNKVQRPKEYIYEWYAKNEKIPVLYIKTRNSIIEELRYKHDVQASIKKDNPNDLTIYTNALNSSVAINLTNERHKLKMYDTFGNLVRLDNSQGYTIIEKGNLSKGIYIMHIISESCNYKLKLFFQ